MVSKSSAAVEETPRVACKNVEKFGVTMDDRKAVISEVGGFKFRSWKKAASENQGPEKAALDKQYVERVIMGKENTVKGTHKDRGKIIAKQAV